MTQLPDHPDIDCCLRTGYPSWLLPGDDEKEETENETDEELPVFIELL